jgi:hypothetical protein
MVNIMKEGRIPIEVGDCALADEERIGRIANSFGFERPFVAVQLFDGAGPMQIRTKSEMPLMRIYS